MGNPDLKGNMPKKLLLIRRRSVWAAIKAAVDRFAAEPPFRQVAKKALKLMRAGPTTRSRWDISARPQYLLGLVTASEQAKRQGVSEISAIEFGVAGGYGLLAMQTEAEAVSKETGVSIQVIGFDLGTGLPSLLPDYRDHPDVWAAGD